MTSTPNSVGNPEDSPENLDGIEAAADRIQCDEGPIRDALIRELARVRREALEEACKVTCVSCRRDEKSPKRWNRDRMNRHFHYASPKLLCVADAIHALMVADDD